jgi:hypothetical protein
MGTLLIFRPTPITSLSNNGKALLIISVWPNVTGSKVPGNKQILCMRKRFKGSMAKVISNKN